MKLSPWFAAILLPGLLGCASEPARNAGREHGFTAYLFSTFKEPEQDGLRFAYSFDGCHWTNVPGVFLRPTVGGKIMRDPSLLRVRRTDLERLFLRAPGRVKPGDTAD